MWRSCAGILPEGRPTVREYDLSEYDVFAEDYDRRYAGYAPDIPFYVEEAKRSGGPALELGCGTGRVMIPVAEAGVEVVGLDGSPAMLEKLRAKLPTLPETVRSRMRVIQGDMRNFDLGQQFALVYIPFRAFLHLLTVEEQKAALACIRRHLRDGGRLALNFFNPALEVIAGATRRWQPFFEAPREEFVKANGNRVVVWNPRHYDAVNQIIESFLVNEEIDSSGRVVDRQYVPLTLRWIYRFEFEHLLAACDFEVEALYGTFDRQPFTREEQELIWVAHKA